MPGRLIFNTKPALDMKYFFFLLSCFPFLPAISQINKNPIETEKLIQQVEARVIAWRRDFHEHPELGNSEVRTAGIVAKHLQSLGIEVKTGVAKTGVVGVLKGGKPGPVVALRADMDALPVTEKVDIPFASKVRTVYNGQETGVMHACGHDSHVAILMGVAEVLAGIRKDIKGTIKFIFQPAEEGAPVGEKGGAEVMINEGVLENPKVDVAFGLHNSSLTEVGKLTYRPGGALASVNDFKVTIKGRPSHGALPWLAVDPIVIASQIVLNLQTVVSRNLDVTQNAGVVTVGSIQGGLRSNIIPEKVELLGTIRALSVEDEKMFIERIKTIVTKTAEAGGAEAEIILPYTYHYPVTFNDPALTTQMLPTLLRTAGPQNVYITPSSTVAEDFSFFQEKVPGLFIGLGGLTKGKNPLTAPSHHTPNFYLDESGFTLGVKALVNLALDYTEQGAIK
jgi:amidohydrolase